MAVKFLSKQVAGAYDIAVDFTDKLDTGRSVSSCVVTAEDLYDNSDVTSTVLDDGTGVVASDVVSEGIKVGALGHQYKIVFTATLDNADVLVENVYMLVEN